MIALSASLLAAQQKTLLVEAESVVNLVESFHLDIMDGIKVPTWGLSIEDIRDLPNHYSKEVHLMVVNPEHYIFELKAVAITIFFVDIKAWPNRKNWGVSLEKIGLVLNPEDDIERNQQIIKEASHILIMGVTPGWSGQSMLPNTNKRIQKIRNLNPACTITIDGGVNDQNAKQLVQAGADKLVIGSYLFQAKDRLAAVNNLQLAIGS